MNFLEPISETFRSSRDFGQASIPDTPVGSVGPRSFCHGEVRDEGGVDGAAVVTNLRMDTSVRPDIVEGLLRGMAQDGRDMESGRGNLHLRKASRASLFVRLQRSWPIVEQTANLRRLGAERLLAHLVDLVPKGVRGKDNSVETTLGRLLAAINGDAILRSSVNDPNKLMDRALLWLHEQQIVTLGKGLSVYRTSLWSPTGPLQRNAATCLSPRRGKRRALPTESGRYTLGHSIRDAQIRQD